MKIALNRKVSKEQKKRKRYPNGAQLVDLYSRRINWAMKLKDALETFYPQYSEELSVIQTIFEDYEGLKRQNNTLDYDDLLLYFLAFLQEPASKTYKKKITHVLVDEYQDVNSVQSQIIDLLATEAKSLTVVGDDAQAIYRFRGADFTHMLEFPKKFPDYSEYKLEENYRSTPEILKLANSSIHHNKKQFKKTLFTSKESGELPALVSCRDREQEAAAICAEILRYREEGIPLHEQAVLFRAGFHSSVLELELNRRNIPYEVRSGMRFFEKAHIKDFLSMLILITNPSDIIQWMRSDFPT